MPILEAEFATRDRDELYRALVEAEVPAAPINAIDEALRDSQVRHRDMVVKVRHRNGSVFRTIGIPVKAHDAAGGEFLSPPGLGADSADVLRGLGYSDDAITALSDAGIVNLGKR
jgi:CoA:oxalate CoA-transferase